MRFAAPCAAALLLLLSAVGAVAQVTQIPWHPKERARGTAAERPAKNGETSQPPALAARAGQAKFSLTYDRLTTLEDSVYYAEGNVRFASDGMLLTADAVTYDGNAQTLLATGDVAVDWEALTAAGRRLFYDLKTGTGWVEEAYAQEVTGAFTVQAEMLRKTGEDWYEVEGATFTSCTAAVPPWSLRVSRGRFQMEHYAHLRDPRFLVRGAPVLYLPYLVWPLKPERSTGFLIPDIGASSDKGVTVSTAFFWAPRDWWDDTVYLDYFEREGLGVGNELRYAFTPRDFGGLQGYFIRQKSDSRNRWSLKWTDFHHFGRGWRAVADINLFSDIDFPRDYQRDYNKATVPGTDSRIFLQRDWGPYYFNATVEHRLQYFTADQDLTQNILPQVEWRSSLQPLGAGLYFGFETSASRFEKDWVAYEEGRYDRHSTRYGRFDAHPYFEWPLHPAPWLDLTPRVEARATYYGSGVVPGTEVPLPGSFWRVFPRFSLDLSGPRFFRRFSGSGLRHVVEPFVQYGYAGRDEDSARVPLFDEVDVVPQDESLLRAGVRNRIYGKDGELRAEAEIYQAKSFKNALLAGPEGWSRRGPVWLLARAWPSRRWAGELRIGYNPLSGDLDRQSLSVTYKPAKEESEDFLRLTYFRAAGGGAPAGAEGQVAPAAREIRLATSLTLLHDRLTLTAFLDKDLRDNRWRQQRGIAWYNGSCFSVGLEGGRREIGDFSETSFRVLVSLKGAGTVLDLYGGGGTEDRP